MLLRPTGCACLLLILFYLPLRTADDRPEDQFGPIANLLDTSTSALRTVKTPRQEFPPGNTFVEDGYSVEAVNATIEQARQRTLAAVPKEDAQLAEYVQRRFPRPVAPERVNWVSAQTARPVFESLRALLNTLRSMPTYRLDLRVVTIPKNARFELVPAVGDQLTTSTDGTITNVFRGDYIYRVKKDGYKKIEESIDLVVRSGDTLECALQESGKSEVPIPCSLR